MFAGRKPKDSLIQEWALNFPSYNGFTFCLIKAPK